MIKAKHEQKEGKGHYLDIISSSFVNTFKETNRDYWFVLLLDTLFVLSCLFLAMGWELLTTKFAGGLGLQSLQTATQQELDAIIQKIPQLYAYIIITAILFLALVLLVFTLFEGYAFSIIKKQKYNKEYFTRFLSVSLVWLLILLFLFIIVSVILYKNQAALTYTFAALFILVIYFGLIIYSIFIPAKGVFNNLKKAFSKGVIKAHYFFTAFIIAFIIFVALNLLDRAVTWISGSSTWIYLLVAFPIMSFYLTWLRKYFVKLGEKVK